MPLPVVHHPAFSAPMPDGHRFPMRKFGRLMQLLLEDGVVIPGDVHVPEPAPRRWLELAHDPSYVDAILTQNLAPEAVRRIGLPITPEVALRSRAASAGTLLTARLALEHGLACNTAGGSHHAFTGFGSGFCVFNDVAVAASVLLAEGRIHRALVVDLDVHQGDGTAAIFEHDERVATFSMHCRTNFPVRKRRSDLDLPLEPETGDAAYLALLAEHLPALLDRVRPDLVFFNAGVDPHLDDRLGRLALTGDGLAARERLVFETCLRRGVPVAGVLGGGYTRDLDQLIRLHAIQHRVAALLFEQFRL